MTPQPNPNPAASERPAYLPETLWDATGNKINETAAAEHFSKFAELQTRVAADDVRKLALPQTPADYKVELPADFQPPVGIEFKFNDADPLIAQARQVMHDVDTGKLSGQEAFSKFLGLYASTQVSSTQSIATAQAAEIAKLGVNGTARVNALETFFDGLLGPGEGKAMVARAFTAADVQRLEKTVTRFASQGVAPFKPGGREPPEPAGRLSQADYDKLPTGEKLAYAKKFDQKQFNGAAAR